MPTFNLRSFKRKLTVNRTAFRKFINTAEKQSPKGITALLPKLEKEVWNDVECLSCANCCKKMTPTFTKQDLNRISAHFGQTPDEFRKQWLKKDSNKDLVNNTQPCQFLNLKDNKCSIYHIRPIDCATFPHLSKKNWKLYAHVHKQNIDYCPATFKLVEKMISHYNQQN